MATQIVRSGLDNTANRDLLKTGTLRDIFDTTLREAKVEYPSMCKTEKADQAIETFQRMAGLTNAIELQEGQNLPLLSPTLGTQKTVTQRIFGAGFRMTHYMDFFNKYNLWKRWSGQLAKSQKEAKDIEIAVMFNNMTSTALTCGVGFDTLAIASNAHTGLASGTGDNYDNYLAQALSVTSIESAQYYFEMLKDDLGYWMGAEPDLLWYEPTLDITAQEIFKSTNRAHELSNTINVLEDIKLLKYHRLTSTTCWGMSAKQHDDFGFIVLTAMEPIFITKDAPDNTLDKVALSLQYFSYGFLDARLLYVGNV